MASTISPPTATTTTTSTINNIPKHQGAKTRLTPNISILRQPPRLWRREHLDVGRVSTADGMTAEEMLGGYVPGDGDEELENISKDLCVDAFDPQNHSLAGPFYEVFSNLLKMRNQNQGGDVLFHDAGWFLSNFTRAIIRLTGARRKFRQMTFANPPFNIPELNLRGHVTGHKIVVGYKQTRRTDVLSVPLIILSVTDKFAPRIKHPETPSALLALTLAYTRNPILDYYDAFVLTLNPNPDNTNTVNGSSNRNKNGDRESNGPTLTITRMRASHCYMRNLFEHKVISEVLPLWRSQAFDMFEAEERREAARVLMGVFRCLGDGVQAEVPGFYGDNWF